MQTFRDEVGALLDPYQRQLYNLIAKPGVSFGHDSAGRLGLLPVLLALGVLRENGTPIRGEENPLVVGMNFRRRLNMSRDRQAAERKIADNIRNPAIHQDRRVTRKSLVIGVVSENGK